MIGFDDFASDFLIANAKGWLVLQSILAVIAALRVFLRSRSDTAWEVLALR